jgi:hypothetical protein
LEHDLFEKPEATFQDHALVVPENGEEDDYWQRYAQQPEKNSFAEAHLQPHVVAVL